MRAKIWIRHQQSFALVVKLTSIRVLLAIVALQDLEVYQVDFKSAFLNGDLNKVIFVTQPNGQILTSEKELVCKLQKSLYGLKQSPRAWYQKLDNFLLENGF